MPDNAADAYAADGNLIVHGVIIMLLKMLPLKGEHNIENILATLLAVSAHGVSLDAMKQTLTTFSGISYRLERLGRSR